jgi:hypothetical protein
MEFIFVLAIVFLKIFFIYLFKIIKVVWAFGIDTFVDNEVFAVFLRNKSMVAVRTFEAVVF